MNENSLLAFALTSALIELTPGPNMGYLAVLAASAGQHAGLAATADVVVGLLSAGITLSLVGSSRRPSVTPSRYPAAGPIILAIGSTNRWRIPRCVISNGN